MKVKYPNCFFLTGLLYRISGLNSIAITAPCVTHLFILEMYSGYSLWVCLYNLNFENVACFIKVT